MQSDARLMRVQLGCASIEFVRARKDMRLNMFPFAIEVETLKHLVEQANPRDDCCKYDNKYGKLAAHCVSKLAIYSDKLHDILFSLDWKSHYIISGLGELGLRANKSLFY